MGKIFRKNFQRGKKIQRKKNFKVREKKNFRKKFQRENIFKGKKHWLGLGLGLGSGLGLTQILHTQS